jgi:hypothetical protein
MTLQYGQHYVRIADTCDGEASPAGMSYRAHDAALGLQKERPS